MTLDELVGADAIAVGVGVSTRKTVLAQLSHLLAEQTGFDAQVILNALLEREKLGTTGFGGGVAIPHGRIAGLGRMFGAILLPTQSIDYDAVDDRPVDIFFALLAPEGSGAEHLKTLARVSRAFCDPGFSARLRGATDAAAVRAILAAGAERAAA